MTAVFLSHPICH